MDIFKENKKIVVAFIAVVTLGLGSLSYYFVSSIMTQPEKQEQKEKVDKKKADKQIVLDDPKKPEYDNEKAVETLTEVQSLFAKNDLEVIISKLTKISNEYSLSQGDVNLRLASILSDATILRQVSEMSDLQAGIDIVKDLSDPISTAFGPLYLIGQVLREVVWDDQSLDPTVPKKVSLVSESFVDKNTQEFSQSKKLSRKLSSEAKGLEGAWKYVFDIDGVQLTAYVSSFDDGRQQLIGYFDEDNNPAVQYQTVAFYAEHSDKIDSAVASDWNENE